MLNTLKNFYQSHQGKMRSAERGNVLFLILIAVVLFAALSYAVTQSSRSGGGGTDGEANLVNSAQITQYPASVRTAIVRMIIGGVDVTQLNFDPPSDFAATCNGNPTPCVFHPQGGGATAVTAPAAVTADGSQAAWIFTSDFSIENISTTANDIVAMLPGVGAAICARLNTELGISNVPDGDGDGVAVGPSTDPDETNNMDNNNTGIGTPADGVAAFDIDGNFSGQPFGCYDINDGNNASTLVYYHVLVER